MNNNDKTIMIKINRAQTNGKTTKLSVARSAMKSYRRPDTRAFIKKEVEILAKR